MKPQRKTNCAILSHMATDKRTLLQGFKLAKWRIQPLTGQIEAPDGSREHVAPKAMEVLVCLARRPGEIVERPVIFKEVWGHLPHSDEALTHCISELRHAFGDKPENPDFLQTVPRRGYRLICNIGDLSLDDAGDGDAPTVKKGAGFLDRQIQDLRKRKVLQTVVGYPVLAWLIVQVVDVSWQYLLQPLGAPAWLVPSFVVLLALGYPIATFLSWAVDLTPAETHLTNSRENTPQFWGLAIVGIATIAITVAALFTYFNAYEAPEPARAAVGEVEVGSAPIPKSIAVLRFLNMSGDPDIGYLGDGLTEELIHELTNLNSIKVAARTSIWPLSISELPVTEIANRLSVEKVLEGSIRSDGGQIRVTAQLIDEKGFHLWSETYDRELADVLGIQKDIATQIVGELSVLLTDTAVARLESRPTDNTSAYDLYLQGRQLLRQPVEPDSLAGAKSLFEDAIELDSRFSLAYAGLCETHLANYLLTRSTDYFGAAERACHRALTLDGGLAEIYTALGNLYRHSGQYIKAEQEYQTALGINPMLEEANFGLGRAYQGQGRLAEAEETLRRSIEMEPGYWGTYLGLGNFLNRQGRYAESVPFYETVTQLEPEYAGGFINLGSSLHWLGRWDEAETAWRKSLMLETDSLGFQNMGTLYYYQHRFAEAVEMQEQAVEAAPSDHRAWGKLAAAQRYVDGYEDISRDSYDRAIELANEQLAVNPDEPEDLYYLSVYRTNTGDLAGAQVAIERALFLAPESPSAHYFAAILQLKSGNDEKAVSELAKAARLGYSYMLLEADPEFAALQENSVFRAMLSKKNN